MQTERGLYVGHVVLEAGTHDFIEPWTLIAMAFPRIAIHPVKPPGSGARNQVGSADQHSALGCCQILPSVEREAGHHRNTPIGTHATDHSTLLTPWPPM